MNENQLQLVTYEQAKRLKDAGFDWETESAWRNFESNERVSYSAPTVSLALKWMRDVKKIYGCVRHNNSLYEKRILYSYCIDRYSDDCNHEGLSISYAKHSNSFYTYEEAESALLDELLNLLDQENESRNDKA